MGRSVRDLTCFMTWHKIPHTSVLLYKALVRNDKVVCFPRDLNPKA